MRRILLILGACVLLFAVETGAARNGKKSFLDFGDIWGSSNAAATSGTDADFTLDSEGSGQEENKVDNTHDDDEDFYVGSGDSKGDAIVDLTTDAPETEDKDEYYYDNNENKATSDDEDDVLEGSGSGDGIDEPAIGSDSKQYGSECIGSSGSMLVANGLVPVTVKPVESIKATTRKQMTACERLRNTALQATSAFKPECDLDGSFKKRQCMVDVAMKEENCWCVDPRGIEVTGTRKKSPMKPDCNFGENLSTCVFQLVQHSQGMLGEYKPKCTLEGEYEPIQCQGSECWCVDVIGDVISSTIVNRPKIPKCPSETTVKPVKPTTKPKTKPLPEPEEPGYKVPDDSSEDITNVIVNIGPEIPLDSDDSGLEEQEEETNSIGEPYATMRHKEQILAQPGLLAAIIGGAVVGLLCMVLLVMFIVYRMRKKDEGSYPLDEQKYQNYSYAKAPDKEFYA